MEVTTHQVTVTRGQLAGLLRVTGDDPSRPALHGVLLEAPGVLVATSGAVLIAVRLRDIYAGPPVILPADYVEAATRLQKRNGAALTLTVTPGAPAPTVLLSGLAARPALDHQYPSWRQVIPAGQSGEARRFDVAQLATVLAALNAILDRGPSSRMPSAPQSYNGDGAAIVYSAPDVLALVMPMRQPPLTGEMAMADVRAFRDGLEPRREAPASEPVSEPVACVAESGPEQFTYHTDPGHGWIAVPRELLVTLGIAGAVSHYSYQSRDGATVYLEEDSDAAKFDAAMRAAGRTWRTVDNYADPCFVRELPAYKA